nr:PorT family protein [Bernardetiaceae bacterium]
QGRDIGLGLMVGRRLGPRSPFTLMSGLNLVRHQYTQRGEARNYVNPYGDYIRFDQYYEWQTQGHQYHFEAPLTLKYRLRKFNRRWSPFVQAGLLFAVEAANKSTYTRSDGFTRNYRDAYFHDLTVGSLVGVGAEFQVTQRVHLMVQPIGSLVNILPSDNGGSRPDTFYGLSLGIYYW